MWKCTRCETLNRDREDCKICRQVKEERKIEDFTGNPPPKSRLPLVILVAVAVFVLGFVVMNIFSGSYNSTGNNESSVIADNDVESDEPNQEQEPSEIAIENIFVGRWVFEDDPSWVTTFNADGTGTHAISWGYGTTFRWSIWGNNIRWSYPGHPNMETRYRITNDALYITMGDGTVYRYIRD